MLHTGGGEDDGSPILRHVRPYVHTYRTIAKGRWLGRSLLEVHTSEFCAHPPAYYAAAIAQGIITVNGNLVGAHYAVRNGDVIEHFQHRHEPPVRGWNRL